MAVTAVTITSFSVVGRSVTIDGTYNHDGGGTNNELLFVALDQNSNGITIAPLNGSSTLGTGFTAGSGIAFGFAGALPEGTYGVINVYRIPSGTLMTSSSSAIGIIKLRGSLAGIWTPRRDSRGLFVPKYPTYPALNGGGYFSNTATAFFYPVRDGVYRSGTDSISKFGQYGYEAFGVPTKWGLGIDAPSGWEWSGKSPPYYATSSGSHVLVSVFSLHDAGKFANSYATVLGESRSSLPDDSDKYAFWRNLEGEQSLLVSVSSLFGGTPFKIYGLGNGLHCLVIAVTMSSGASGLRAFLNGSLVAVSSAPTYSGFLYLRPYYYHGSISQRHRDIGNVLLNAEAINVNLTDSAAAALSLDPYRYFFRDAPSTSLRAVRNMTFDANVYQSSRPSSDVSNSGWVRVP